MPTETTYGPYTISTLPGGNGAHAGQLHDELSAGDSGITVQVKDVTTSGDQLNVTFKDVLPSDQKNLLDGDTAQAHNDPPTAGSLLGQHDGTPVVDTQPVSVQNNLVREDGVQYFVPKPGGYGMKMCDRDFRVNTSIYAPADSFEDLWINPTSLLEAPWGEMAQQGVYKDDGGSMVACTDQTDCDANCVLSVFDYCARLPADQSLVKYEIRDGILYVDPNLFVDVNAPTPTERFGTRAYAVIAPAIPGPSGGSIAVFDGYLGSDTKRLTVEALSPQAEVLDPAGPAGAAGVCLRLYIYHPAGQKLSHVLRLVTYRAPGTFPS
jgi:hypothetical protein